MANIKEKTGLEPRPPVVAILGHIDHGKSTLIDYIRKTNVVEKEAGGITQHVSAYEIKRLKDGIEKKVTFLDTPGHEAFTKIRTRSAGAADIAALVISAEDGVKPQTLEVLKHIKESNLPYVVVITKIDKPSADIAKTKQNLAEHGIYVEGFGGDTTVIELSALTGKGVEDFLDMILLMAEMDAKTGDPEALGSGVIIESRRDPKRGVIAVGIIKDGTVRRGLFAASRGTITPLRFLLDSEDNSVEEITFSSPVQMIGWDDMPKTGEEFKTFLKKDDATAYANEGETAKHEDIKKMEEGVTPLSLIVKADTLGSLEAVIGEIEKLSRERIMPKIVSQGVGIINENDVKSAMATTGGAIIFGFNTKIDSQALHLADRSGVSILSFNIIYELQDKVKELLEEREPRIEVEEIESVSKILKIFGATKGKQIIGGRVNTGVLKRGTNVKILRREALIGIGKIKELQQAKIAAEIVNEGIEFGAMLESKTDIAPGDIIQAITLVTK